MRAKWWIGLAVCLVPAPAPAQSDPVRWKDFTHTETRFELVPPSDARAWAARAAEVRARVRWAAGLLPELERARIAAEVVPRWEDGRCRVSAVRFESAPGLFVFGNLYEPLGGQGPFPVVLSPHGHWSAGRFENGEECSVPARCTALARAGALVFAYDMLGFGDSQHQLGHREPLFESEAAAYYGLSSFALQTWNSIRVLDFVLDLPGADAARVAITGASGGGTQSFVLACVDERVRVCAPVNMVSATMQGGCPCENAAGLRWGTCNPELAATFAPRPLLLVSASGDWTRETPQREFPYVRSIYALIGAEAEVANAHFDAGHNYNAATRRAVYAFFAEKLFGGPHDRVFDEAGLPPIEELKFHRSPPAEGELSHAAAAWLSLRSAVEARVASLSPRDVQSTSALRTLVREALDRAAGSAMPQRDAIAVHEDAADGCVRLERAGRSVLLRRLEQGPRVALIVHPLGLAAEQALAPETRELRRDGYAVALLEIFGSGASARELESSSRGSTRYFSTFNRTTPSEALEDLATALAWYAGDPETSSLALIGRGECGPLVLAAAARIDEAAARSHRFELKVDLFDCDESERWYTAHLALPNLGRVGGVPALLAVQAALSATCTGCGRLEHASWARTAAALERRELRLLSGAQAKGPSQRGS